MPRPPDKTKPSSRARRPAKTSAAVVAVASRVQEAAWPEVLTLTEAAAYLRVPEMELVRAAGSQGPPGRLIGSEWRFSRAAIQDWLRRPSMKDSLLQVAGAWKDDPYLDGMLEEIYRQRGRPMTEEAT